MHRSSHVFVTMLMTFALLLPLAGSTLAQADAGTPATSNPVSRTVDQVPEPTLPAPTATSPSIANDPPASDGSAESDLSDIAPTIEDDQRETAQVSPQLSITAIGGDVPAGTAVHVDYLSHGSLLVHDVTTQAGATITLDLPPLDAYSTLHIRVTNATGFQDLAQSVTINAEFLIIPLQLQPLPVPIETAVPPTATTDANPTVKAATIMPTTFVEPVIPTATTAPGPDSAIPPALIAIDQEPLDYATPGSGDDAIGIEAVGQVDLAITVSCDCDLDLPLGTSYYVTYVSGGEMQRRDGPIGVPNPTPSWTLHLYGVDIGSTVNLSVTPPYDGDLAEFVYGAQRMFTIGGEDLELEMLLEKGFKDVAYSPPVEITLPDADAFPAGSKVTYSNAANTFQTIGDDDIGGASSPVTVSVRDNITKMEPVGVTPDRLYGVRIEVPGYRTWVGTYLPSQDAPLHVTLQRDDTPDFVPILTLETADGAIIPGPMNFQLYNETAGHILAAGFEDTSHDPPTASGATWEIENVVPGTEFQLVIIAPGYANYRQNFVVNELNPNFTAVLQREAELLSTLQIFTSDGADIPVGTTISGTTVNNGTTYYHGYQFESDDDRASGTSLPWGSLYGGSTYSLSITGAGGYAPLTHSETTQTSPAVIAVELQKIEGTVKPSLEIRTSDGQAIPENTGYEIRSVGGDIIYSGYVGPGVDSGTVFPIYLDMSNVALEVPENTTLEISLTLDLVDDPDYRETNVDVVVTSANPVIVVTLHTPSSGRKNLTITTSNGDQVPAGTSITMYSNGGVSFFHRLEAAQDQPYTVLMGEAQDGASYRILISGASGFEVFDQTLTRTGSQPWEAQLQADTSTSTSPLTVTTSDGAPIPAGTHIGVTNTSDSGASLFDQTLTGNVFSGAVFDVTGVVPNSYLLVAITGADGYQDTTQRFVVNSVTPTMELELQASEAKASSVPALQITTSNGENIPAGTNVQVINFSFGEPVVLDQTVRQAINSGVTLNLPPVVDGSILRIAISGATGYYDLSRDFTLDPENTLLAVELQADDVPNVNLTIAVAEGTTIPDGTTWALTTLDGSPLQDGSVPTGSTAPWSITLPVHVAVGTYTISVSSPALYYSEEQSLVVTGSTASATFTIARPVGTLTGTVNTEGDDPIPSGTTWVITGSNDVVAASGTLTGGTASEVLYLPDPLGYGEYFIDITPTSNIYLPYTGRLSITQATTTLTFTLIEADLTKGGVNLTVATSDEQPIPTGAIITIGGVSYTVRDGGMTATDIASGALIPFNNVPVGLQTVLVTNAAPYEDFQGSTTVIGADVIELGITLELAAGDDTGVDTGNGTGTDSGTDDGTDAGTDTGVDTGGSDSGIDTGSDAGTDTGVDSGVDSGNDAGSDTGVDTGVDGSTDGGGDTGSDSGVDNGIDDSSDPDAKPTVIPGGLPSSGQPGSGAGNQDGASVTSLPTTGQGATSPSPSAVVPLLILAMLLLLAAASGAFRHQRR